MKRHLQCAEQQMSRANLAKYCACHAERLTCLILITYQTSFTMRGATGVPLQPPQILRLPRKLTRQNFKENVQKQVKRHFQCGDDPSMIRPWSEHDPTMIRPWSDHETDSPQPASPVRLLFELTTSIFYWKIQRFAPNLTFKHSPNAAPATKSGTRTSPNTAPAMKSNTWTSPSTAPATKSGTRTSPNTAPTTKSNTWTSPSTTPATKSDTWTSPNTAPTTKSNTWTSPSTAPATKSDTWTSPSAAPATKSNTWISPGTAPATKSDTWISPNAAPVTQKDSQELHQILRLPWKVTLELHQVLHLPQKVALELHQILRLPRKVTLELHQVLHLPRKVTLELHRILRLPQKVTLELHQVLHLPRKVPLELHQILWHYSTWHYLTLLYLTLLSTWHYSTWLYLTLLDTTLLDCSWLYLTLLDTTLLDFSWLHSTWLDSTLLNFTGMTLLDLTLLYLTLLGCRSYIGSFSAKLPLIIKNGGGSFCFFKKDVLLKVTITSWWLNQPIWKIYNIGQIGSISPILRAENKKKWFFETPPPRQIFVFLPYMLYIYIFVYMQDTISSHHKVITVRSERLFGFEIWKVIQRNLVRLRWRERCGFLTPGKWPETRNGYTLED